MPISVSVLSPAVIQSDYHIVIAQYLQDPRVGPHAVLHLAAVDAAVTGEVYEQGLVHALGVCPGLLKLEEALQVVRKMEKVAVFWRLAVSRDLCSDRSGRAACHYHRSLVPKDEILSRKRRQISGQPRRRTPLSPASDGPLRYA